MAVKRMLEVDSNSSGNQALKLIHIGRYLGDLDSQFWEGWARKTVREEVEGTFQKLLMPPPINLIAAVACQYELHFNCVFPKTFFTHQPIKAEKGKVEIVIRDAISKKTISNGHLSSKNVRIVVLADSGFDEQDNWTKDEFEKSVVRPRKDKRPLLIGQQEIKLNNGVGYLDNISFTDNSSWTRCGKFRLGAIINESSSSGQRIREAKSEAFFVKEQRLAANRKDCSLSLNDGVGRLKHIGGNYSGRLANGGIKTVHDFLRRSDANPNGLREMLSIMGSRMTEKRLKEIVLHTKGQLVDLNIYQESQLQYPSLGNGDTAIKILPNHMTSLPSQTFVPAISNMNRADNLPSSHQIHVGYGGDTGLFGFMDPPVPSNQFVSDEVFEAAVEETLPCPNMSLPFQDDTETPGRYFDSSCI